MEASFESHVNELKQRIVRSAVVFTVAAAGAMYFSPMILEWLQADLGVTLNALVAYEVLYTQIMIAMLIGLVVSLPYLIYQLLKFMEPGLKDREYRTLRNFIPFSLVLFFTGAGFAYRFIVKSSFAFFESVTQASTVGAVWGLRNTIGFALKLSAFTGLMFQLPIVALVLSRAGLLSSGMMKKYRSYFVVAVLLLAAVATPPDIVTQVLLTAPVLGLYQLSTFLVGRTERV